MDFQPASKLRAHVKNRFADQEIILNPKMRDLKRGQTIVDRYGRIGTVTDFDPTLKPMWNNATGFHSVCASGMLNNYDETLKWSEVYCLVNTKEISK